MWHLILKKLTPDSLQWLLCPTQPDHSSVSHSLPVILCGVYSPAAILVFLLGSNVPNMLRLCMVHSLPLLRLLFQRQQRLLDDFLKLHPTLSVCCSLTLACYFFFYQTTLDRHCDCSCVNYHSTTRVWTAGGQELHLDYQDCNTAWYIAGA